MNPTDQTCSTDRIDAYLEECLDLDTMAEFEDHLSSCEYCQIELQRRAAEPDVWQDAVALLSDESHEDFLERVSSAEHNSISDDSFDEMTEAYRDRHTQGVLDSLAPTDDPEMLGRIGDYEISGVVGVGGMGAVLKGFDRTLRRVVAIKVMAPHLAGSGSARARFQREARAAAAITHDNVIDTYGVAEANGLPYLVMPFARGPSLHKRINDGGPLTTVEVVRIGRQIAAGLAAAHEQGLVHRDIKPANILLNEGIERLWITDFGVARAMDDASMTRTGVIAGTPQYMSPEQARGESVDHRSDLFSMGSVLYTACTGRPPFRSEAAYGMLRRITDTDPRPISEINPETPAWLSRIIERLMAKHPTARYQSATEVAQLLEGCLAHLQQPAHVALPPSVVSPEASVELAPNTTELGVTALDVTAPDATESPDKTNLVPRQSRTSRKGIWAMIAFVLVAGLGLTAFQLSQPVDISGRWAGESWQDISLTAVDEAEHWYTGSFTDQQGRRGAVQLEWSRLQRRYNGRWKIGGDLSGSVTVRATNRELRGAISLDPDSSVAANTARLREFSWQRSTTNEQKKPGPSAFTGNQVPIQATISGQVARWGKQIREGQSVNKGELIVVLKPTTAPQQLNLQQGMPKGIMFGEEVLVQSKRRELESIDASIDSLAAQQKAYEASLIRVTNASNAAVRAAEIQIKAAKSDLTKYTALLAQEQLDADRQQELFDKKVASKRALEVAKQKVNVAKADVDKAKTAIEAAEVGAVAKAQEASSNRAKAEADLKSTVTQLTAAKAKQKTISSELAKAQAELAKAKNDFKSQLAANRQSQLNSTKGREVHITAAITGRIVRLSRKQTYTSGETICVLQAEQPSDLSNWSGTSPGDANTPTLPPRFSAVPAPTRLTETLDGLPRRAQLSGGSITETLDECVHVGGLLRKLRARLEIAKKRPTKQSTQLLSQLDRDRKAALLQVQATVNILAGKLEAAKELLSSQTSMNNALKRKVNQGEAPPATLLSSGQAITATKAEISQIAAILAHCANLQKAGTTYEDDRKLVLTVLKLQLEAEREKYAVQSQLSKQVRRLFELGNGTLENLLKAEQSEASTKAEVRRLEAVVEYYNKVQPTETDLGNAARIGTADDGLITPQSEQERAAIIQVLSARLEAAKAKLSQADNNLQRAKVTFQRGLTSNAEYDTAKTNATAARAVFDELVVKIDYYRAIGIGRNSTTNKAAAEDARPAKASGPATILTAPVKGRIIRWGTGVVENARVTKGDLIAEIADLDPTYDNRLKAQQQTAERAIEAAKSVVASHLKSVEVAETTVESYTAQIKAYQLVKQQTAAASDAAVKSAENKVQAQEAELAQHQAVLDQTKANHDRQAGLFAKKIISQLKFQEAERKFKEASARVAKAKADLDSAKNDVSAKRSEALAKEQKANVDLQYAAAILRKGKADQAKVESELAAAKAKVVDAEKSLLDIQTRRARSRKTTIIAPFTGFVTKLSRRDPLKEGDVICHIWPE